MNAPTKSAVFKTRTAVVRSPKPPAIKDEYRAFDDFARLARMLVDRFDDIVVREKADAGDTADMLAAFFGGLEYFERDALYQHKQPHRPNLMNVWTDWQITRRVVSEQVGALLGSFPNAVPHAPKVYTTMLIEEIIAANPSALALESACREIRRSKTFAPAIAEVLALLREHEERWNDQRHWITELDERLQRRALPAGGDR